MLDNIFINNYLKIVPNFKGVFSSNEISNLNLKPNCCIIVNFSNNNEKGSHFIVIFNKNNTMIYFDPLNIKKQFIPKNIKKYLKNSHRKIKYLNCNIQSFNSTYCGFFCIGFILHMYNTNKENSFKKLFNIKDLIKNDGIIIQIIIHYVKNK